MKDRESLRSLARLLAKYGVNLVRIHGGLFDVNGDVNMDSVRHAIDVVECMNAEGIYSHFSSYFPVWLAPKPGTSWQPGWGRHGNRPRFRYGARQQSDDGVLVACPAGLQAGLPIDKRGA